MNKKKNLPDFNIGFDKIFSYSGTPLILIDSKANVLLMNKEAGKLFGKPPSDFVGEPVSRVFPELTPSFFKSLNKGFKKDTLSIVKSKDRIKIKITALPLIKGKKSYFLIFVNDHSKQEENKRLNNSVKSSELSDSFRLKALFDNVDVMLWSIRKDSDGKIYYEHVNDAFANVTNRTAKDYNGKLLKTLGSKKDFETIKHTLGLAKEKGVHTYERDLLHRGVKKWFVIRIIYVGGENNTEYYIGSGVDVTLVKKSEELALLSEKKYRDLAHTIPVALARFNFKSQEFEFFNAEFTKQSGYTLEEFNSFPKDVKYNIIHPDDRERIMDSIDEWSNNGFNGVLHNQYRAYNKSREILWLDAFFYSEFLADGSVESINQVYLDITETKQNEELLRLNEKMYRDLSQYAPLGIAHTDVSTGRYSFVNDEFTRQCGYTLDEFNVLSDKQIDEMVYSEDREKHNKAISEWVLNGHQGVLHSEYRAYNRYNKLVWLDAYFYAEFDKEKKLKSINQIYIDVTERKKAEEELKRSLLEKEILLKEVYHRVKNNLQVINSLLQIQSLALNDPVAIEMFKETQRRIRIMSMIHEKLYKSKDLTNIDFSSYIFNLVDYIKQSYSFITENIETEIKTMEVDLGLNKAIPCGLIINELVSNSYKYAFEPKQKGKISVELNSDKGEYFTLIVKDNGKGFPKNIDFMNTESLGMVIVNSFVDQLNGIIELDRSEGTKFTIKFPSN
jgi:PAS domain S-box-containing protein